MLVQYSGILRSGWDERKPVRAAAFAGWAFVSSLEPDILNEDATMFCRFESARYPAISASQPAVDEDEEAIDEDEE